MRRSELQFSQCPLLQMDFYRPTSAATHALVGVCLRIYVFVDLLLTHVWLSKKEIEATSFVDVNVILFFVNQQYFSSI